MDLHLELRAKRSLADEFYNLMGVRPPVRPRTPKRLLGFSTKCVTLFAVNIIAFVLTDQGYVDWTRRYIYFHNKQHPKIFAIMGAFYVFILF